MSASVSSISFPSLLPLPFRRNAMTSLTPCFVSPDDEKREEADASDFSSSKSMFATALLRSQLSASVISAALCSSLLFRATPTKPASSSSSPSSSTVPISFFPLRRKSRLDGVDVPCDALESSFLNDLNDSSPVDISSPRTSSTSAGLLRSQSRAFAISAARFSSALFGAPSSCPAFLKAGTLSSSSSMAAFAACRDRRKSSPLARPSLALILDMAFSSFLKLLTVASSRSVSFLERNQFRASFTDVDPSVSPLFAISESIFLNVATDMATDISSSISSSASLDLSQSRAFAISSALFCSSVRRVA
mmetsp:Transcript_27536/g.66174  ORF Transcript_27536/g.66174 Transcript_27536/m.66174 type:complete len:306 (-) Transcript_27536:3588-4505(-)